MFCFQGVITTTVIKLLWCSCIKLLWCVLSPAQNSFLHHLVHCNMLSGVKNLEKKKFSLWAILTGPDKDYPVMNQSFSWKAWMSPWLITSASTEARSLRKTALVTVNCAEGSLLCHGFCQVLQRKKQMDWEQIWMPKQYCKVKNDQVGQWLYYYNHVFITPSSRKKINSSLCAFLIKKEKGKNDEADRLDFPTNW